MATDDATRERWRREVLHEWTDPRTIAAWRTWHDASTEWARPYTDLLLNRAQLQPGMQVLDIASGTGNPALTIAQLVGPTGQVIGTDVSAALLAIAKEHAERTSQAHLTFEHADVEALPFPDQRFDAVTCRFGIMYFPDPVRGLREMRRVLTDGGRATVLAWGTPERMEIVDAFLSPFMRRAEALEFEPGAPQPYRYAESGLLGQQMREAGFQTVDEQSVTVETAFPGTAEDVLRFWLEVVALQLEPVLERVPPTEREAARAEALENLRRLEDAGAVRGSSDVVVASGAR